MILDLLLALITFQVKIPLPSADIPAWLAEIIKALLALLIGLIIIALAPLLAMLLFAAVIITVVVLLLAAFVVLAIGFVLGAGLVAYAAAYLLGLI